MQVIFKKEIYTKKIETLTRIVNALLRPHLIPTKLIRKSDFALTRLFLNKKRKIMVDGKCIFTMRDFGEITNMRINTFSSKEPETLKWIDSFKKDDTLLDIGANVGIYSLYAASRGHKVKSIEPDALNFALLNLNIQDNGFNLQIIAYPYSVHKDSALSVLNIHQYSWGATASSFDRSLNWMGKSMTPSFKQGSPGISVDDLSPVAGFFLVT